MSNNRYEPAQPAIPGSSRTGLTKREYAAIQIMAGFAASSEDGPATIGDIAEYAVNWADALFDELDKTF